MDIIRVLINIIGFLAAFTVLVIIILYIFNALVTLYVEIRSYCDNISCRRKRATCTICLNEVFAKPLECGHVFHPQCIKKWRKNNNTCPNCRASFV